MDEYIKKSYAVDAILDVYYNTPDIDLSGEKFEAAIFKIPVADVAPVRHGYWEPRDDAPGFVRCSNCKNCNIYNEWADGKKWSYCPHCGAQMDLED